MFSYNFQSCIQWGKKNLRQGDILAQSLVASASKRATNATDGLSFQANKSSLGYPAHLKDISAVAVLHLT